MKNKIVSIVLLVALLLTMFKIRLVSAVPPSLECSYRWPDNTFGYGVSADDVDGDGNIEIVTVGIHWRPDGSSEGSLQILRYDGKTINSLVSQPWHTLGDTLARKVFIKDVDNDGVKEILTVGDSKDYGQLRIWNYDGTTVTLEHGEGWITGPWTTSYDVYADDIDRDGRVEIVTVGSTGGNPWHGQLKIWRWDGTTLTMEHSEEWDTDASGAEWDTEALGVFVADVDNDGIMEIVTAGILSPPGSGGLSPHQCQLKIWWYSIGRSLIMEKTSEWNPSEAPPGSLHDVGGNLVSVFVDDVDNDGQKEIVSAGRAQGKIFVNGYLAIQTWDGSKLVMEKEEKWFEWPGGDTEAFGLYIKDVDKDGEKEIVTVGALHMPPYGGQLKAYTWTYPSIHRGVLTLKWDVTWSSGSWGDASYAYGNYIGDIDADGVVEILAVGRTVVGTIDHALITIWSPGPYFPPPSGLLWSSPELVLPINAETPGWDGWWFRHSTGWFMFNFTGIDSDQIDNWVIVTFNLGVTNMMNGSAGLDGLIDVVINPGMVSNVTYPDVLLDNIDSSNRVFASDTGGSYLTYGQIFVPKRYVIDGKLLVKVIRQTDDPATNDPATPSTEVPINMRAKPPSVPTGVYENNDAHTVHIYVGTVDVAGNPVSGGHIVKPNGCGSVAVTSDRLIAPILSRADLNADGEVDLIDIVMAASNFGIHWYDPLNQPITSHISDSTLMVITIVAGIVAVFLLVDRPRTKRGTPSRDQFR